MKKIIAAILPPHLQKMLIDASRTSIAARSENGRSTRRHNDALSELDIVIGQVMNSMPRLFLDRSWHELEVKRRGEM